MPDGVVLDVQVTKADVDAALGVMNFAIYHKELTDMDEREAEREREQDAQKKRMAENSNADNDEDSPTDNKLVLYFIICFIAMFTLCSQQVIAVFKGFL